MEDKQHDDYQSVQQEDGAEDTAVKNKLSKWFPTKQKIYLPICHLMILVLSAAIAYSILGNQVLPKSEIFALGFLYVWAFILGKVMECLRLPPLLGMLIAGFLFRNLTFIPYYEDISVRWASTLRGSALVIILLKAGLGLDADQLKKLSLIVLQLAFIPCIVETISLGIASHFFLQLPWMWSIMLGFVISAVSPAVVVPSLLSLQERHYGTRKGVPTLVVAAASVDDILAITGFTIMLSISLSGGSWIWSLGKGLLEPLAGFIFGLSCGCILWFIPGKDISEASLSAYRVILLCCGGLAVLFCSKILDFAGAGPFGCLVLGFVAAYRWKTDPGIFSTIEDAISILWTLLQPFLFSLIGCEVTIASLEKDIGNSLIALAIGCVFRILTAFSVTFGAGLNVKEKIFIAFAWLPKATVQAAVGPQALDYVLVNDKGPEMEEYAKKVLGVAVLSILLTAPLGAVLIALLGPVLLHKDDDVQENEDVQEKNSIELEEQNTSV